MTTPRFVSRHGRAAGAVGPFRTTGAVTRRSAALSTGSSTTAARSRRTAARSVRRRKRHDRSVEIRAKQQSWWSDEQVGGLHRRQTGIAVLYDLSPAG